MEKFTPLATNFTLPPALTGWTNFALLRCKTFSLKIWLCKKSRKQRITGGICQCRQCRRQCKIFASGVNFSIFTHFLCFFLLKLLKLGEIDGVKFLA